ncbi:MAG: DNA polymerase III subunit gamma/tau [Planctomycetes bacterium]|nr:DNA polymerase III subunit gamma/tau [Planctomycetota bacterium]
MTEAPAATDDSQPHGEYVVVARRYRPQTFEELIGQQHVSQALSRAIASDRVGHAYLFTGARGVGKTSAARILAKALNCAQGTSPTPCNQCEICESVSTGDDVDVLEIDGASNRGIDEIRQLRQNVAVRPSRCRFKIYIIDEVHMLTKEAFNALLKTLEEPPEHVKFIFATTEPNKIPVTILSRCQRYDFAGIEAGEIQERLSQIATIEGVTIEEDALQILAMRAAGSMRDSQSLLEQLLSTGTKAITSADVTKMLGIAPAARLSRLVLPLVDRNAAEVLSELDAAIAEGAEVSQLLDQLLGYFRDVMTQTVGCDETQMLYALPGQRQEVREVAEKLGVQTLLAIVQILDQTAARMRVSTHTRTLAEMAIVRVCHLADLDELATLIAELKRSPGEQSLPAVKKNVITNAPPQRAAPPSPPERAGASPPPVTPAPATSVAEHAPARAEASSAVAPAATATAVAEEPKESTLLLSAENVDMIWKQVLDLLSGMVADIAAEADDVAVDERGRLIVSFSQNFHREVCEKPGNRSRLETALRTACGQEVPLVFRASARVDAAQSVAPPKPSRRATSRSCRRTVCSQGHGTIRRRPKPSTLCPPQIIILILLIILISLPTPAFGRIRNS